jgi:S-methylmethionine-dependent homocysteine/selenocysteine methylase
VVGAGAAGSAAAIRQLHLDYLLAGADIITTSSYQASLRVLPGVGWTGSKPPG